MRLAHFSLAFALFCSASSCLKEKTVLETEKTETVSLPGGEILTTESFLTLSSHDSFRRLKLFFQKNASSQRETVIEFLVEGAAPISLRSDAPQLFTSGDRTALRIGSHIFLRWPRKAGPYWHHETTAPNAAASIYLRSFLSSSDSRIAVPSGNNTLKWFETPKPDVPYAFDHYDFEQNVLVTKRDTPENTFPEFLVYSANQYGFPWGFDIERTRNANSFKPPLDSGVIIDFSVVTYPGELDLRTNSKRSTCLLLPGAQEIHAQSLPLSSSKWTPMECSFAIPNGIVIKDRFDVLLGFLDPLPDHLSIFYRHHPVLSNTWQFIKFGDWICADASGFNGGLARVAFFRIRHTQTK
jgi:hypothetical protein